MTVSDNSPPNDTAHRSTYSMRSVVVYRAYSGLGVETTKAAVLEAKYVDA